MAFAVPTYFFVVMMFLTVGIGLFRYFTGSLGTVVDPPEVQLVNTLGPVTAFLLLHAFANGTTALTGVEAISNGIMAFKEPRSRNAGLTLVWMSIILGTLFLSISYLTAHIGGVYSEEETIISQLTRTVFDGRGPLYICDDWCDNGDPPHGSKYCLCRFSTFERAGGRQTAICRAN